MSLEGKRILVTSGGTSEYIDDVRVLTNISTGKLGAMIADSLACERAEVQYLHGRNARIPSWLGTGTLGSCVTAHPSGNSIECTEVRSAQDAYDAMEKLVPQMDAVVHAMAVSDFTFKRDAAIKCSSSDAEAFIEYMRQTITKNPKIIGKVKEWNPRTILIGFKFEVGLGLGELVTIADKSITTNGCDLVVANDKAEMTREKEHVAHFVYSEAMQQAIGKGNFEVRGKHAIAEEVTKFLSEVL